MTVDFSESSIVDIEMYQYDFGQQLEIEGVELPEDFEMHFQNGTGIPEIRRGSLIGGKAVVAIPDVTLQLPYDLVSAWLYIEAEGSGTTVKTVNIHLHHRERPEDVPPIEDAAEIKSYAEYVRENAEKVATAESVAESLIQRANAGEFNGADGAQGPEGKQGPPGRDGLDAITDTELDINSNNAIANSAVTEMFEAIGTVFGKFFEAPLCQLKNITSQEEFAELLMAVIEEEAPPTIARIDFDYGTDNSISMYSDFGNEEIEKGDYILFFDRFNIELLKNPDNFERKKEWKKLCDITTEKDVQYIAVSQDDEGNPFEVSKLYIEFEAAAGTGTTNLAVVNGADYSNLTELLGFAQQGLYTVDKRGMIDIDVSIPPKSVCKSVATTSTSPSYQSGVSNGYFSFAETTISGFHLRGGNTSKIPQGSHFEIWGCK